MDQAIQKRITRRIAVIVGAFALGLAVIFGLISSLERRNDDMRSQRVEVREFFRVLTAFQGDFDQMIRASGAIGLESPMIDRDAFAAAETAARGRIEDLARLNGGASLAARVDKLRADLNAYAAASGSFITESIDLGLAANPYGQASALAEGRTAMVEPATSSHAENVLAAFTGLSRFQFEFLRNRVFNVLSEAEITNTADRDAVLRALDVVEAAGKASAMTPAAKAAFLRGAGAYRAAINQIFEGTGRRSRALLAMGKTQAQVGQDIGGFRQALFAANDVVYAKEENYRAVSRTTVGVAVVLLSLGFVFLIVVVGGRLRREAFLEQDRAKIFKDFALSSRSVSWETDASCRYTRRETSGTQDDSIPGRLGGAMVEAECHPSIAFDGVSAFDLVGERKPYRDVLFAHISTSGRTWWRSSGTPYYDLHGRFLGYRGITIDVTETKNYERAVADSVARSRDFAAASSDELWEIDGEGVVRALETQNPFAEDMRRIGLGRKFSELAAAADVSTEAGESLDRYIELRQPFRDVVYSGLDLRTGRREWYRMSGVPFFDPRTGAMGMRCVNARITMTRVLELENAERQRQLEALVSDLPIIVQRLRRKGPEGVEFTYVSPGMETILGIPAESLLGPNPALRYRDIVHPDDRHRPVDAVRAALDEGKDYELTYRARTTGGVYRTLQSRGRALVDAAGVRFVESIALDVTEAEERREREAELQGKLVEAQKMEAMGRLAGGIAHDFNNILGATRSFGDLLADGLEDNPRLRGYATRIVAACDRAADMVRQILTFTRAKDAPREVVKVAEAVHELEVLLASRLPPRITLAVSNRAPESVLVVNPTHLTQVLLNLAVNAIDALDQAPGQIGGQKGGRIEIGIAETTVGEAPPFSLGLDAGGDGRTVFYANGVLTPGSRYLCLSVSDTGPGIPQDIAAKVFDPFFTTKDKRKGSGLGLSVVTGIVGAQGGVIAVESVLGQGTTFNVYFPAVRVSRAAERAGQTEKRAVDKSHVRGRERILIVDDEIDVADALSYALTNLGYETAPVYSPTEALEIFAEGPDAWDVLITDQSMPDLKGLDLIRRVRFIRPGLRTILCTGYSDATTESVVAGDGVDAFFTKPVPADVIAAAVRSFFDARDALRA